MRNYRQHLALVTLLVLLSACASNPYSLPGSEPKAPAPATVPAQPPAPTSEAARPDTGAESVLVSRAREARDAGDYDRALAFLERAQRIDPDDASVYLELARTHAAAGNAAQAKAMAERGLLYCNGSAQCGQLRELSR